MVKDRASCGSYRAVRAAGNALSRMARGIADERRRQNDGAIGEARDHRVKEFPVAS